MKRLSRIGGTVTRNGELAEMDFHGKKALVTGSGTIGGLGHAIARLLIAGGAEVTITGTDPARGMAVVRDLSGSARFVRADLGDAEQTRDLAAETGPVDVLINNAAFIPAQATVDQSVDALDHAFAVNVRAAFILTAHLAPKMAANGGGSIVNVSSTAAGLGMPGLAVYGATKAALESLTRTWAVEFSSSGIRVNAVSPGPMSTSMVLRTLGPDGGGVAATVPMKRMADPAEVAEVVAFVAGHRAGFVTGATIAADGGRTAI